MKTKVNFIQGNNSLEMSFDVTESNNLNLIVGTAVNRLYQLVNVAKATGARVINLSKPVDVVIEVNGKRFTDTFNLDERLRNRIKVNRKKQRTFALRVKALLEFAMSEIQIVDIDDLKDDK